MSEAEGFNSAIFQQLQQLFKINFIPFIYFIIIVLIQLYKKEFIIIIGVNSWKTI